MPTITVTETCPYRTTSMSERNVPAKITTGKSPRFRRNLSKTPSGTLASISHGVTSFPYRVRRWRLKLPIASQWVAVKALRSTSCKEYGEAVHNSFPNTHGRNLALIGC